MSLDQELQTPLKRPSGVKILASHALLIGPVAERLGKLPIEKIYVSDSVPAPDQFPLPLQISSLASLLAETIQRLHRLESLGGVLAHQ
jgi:ribose-phosphate pyrophosphokinase